MNRSDLFVKNININNNAFDIKKRFVLCAGIVLASSLVFNSGIGNANNNDKPKYFNKKPSISAEKMAEHFGTVYCNFYNLGDDNYVVIQNVDGNISAMIGINSDGSSENLTAYLNPGSYYVISNHSSKEQVIKFDINDIDDSLVLDIDCSNGNMEIHNKNNSKILK